MSSQEAAEKSCEVGLEYGKFIRLNTDGGIMFIIKEKIYSVARKFKLMNKTYMMFGCYAQWKWKLFNHDGL